MKIYIVGGGAQYARMFETEPGFSVVDYPKHADALQFTGGADVSPHLYDEYPHPTTYSDRRRDDREVDLYRDWVGKKVMLGICRGSQFLNVMNEGTLYQDVDNHAIGGVHPCMSEHLGKLIDVTSTHHQMMRPTKEAFIEGWAWKLSKHKQYMARPALIGSILNDYKDVEVAYYGETRSLCFQPHPEFAGAHTTRDYYFSCIREYLA